MDLKNLFIRFMAFTGVMFIGMSSFCQESSERSTTIVSSARLGRRGQSFQSVESKTTTYTFMDKVKDLLGLSGAKKKSQESAKADEETALETEKETKK